MLKYVRFTHPTEGEVFAFTVPPISHANLANSMRPFGYQPVSAGFVHFGPAAGITTHGRSESLKLGPQTDDALMISGLYDIVGKQVREDAVAARHPVSATTV